MHQLGTGDRIAIVAFIGGLAVTLAAMALPLAYPDLPTWGWRLIFWPSLVLTLGAMGFLVYDLGIRTHMQGVQLSRLEKVVVSPLTIALMLTITSAVAWGWYFLDRANGPIIWTFGDGPHPIFGMRGGGSERPFISTLQISGNNRSDEPVSNIDGFLRSNITNKKLPLFFQIDGQYVRTVDTNGVPPHTDFMIIVPFTDDQAKFETIAIPSDQFLSEYKDLTLSVMFDGRGSPYVRNFPCQELARVINEFEKFLRDSNQQTPTITLK